MKPSKLLFILLLPLLFGQGVKGQGYKPLVENNKKWSTLTIMIDFYHTYWTEFADDTIINGLVYKKVVVSDSLFFSNGKRAGYIREDSAKKVYFMNTLFEEGLIYDFDVNQGDTFQIYNTGGITYYGTNNHYEEIEVVVDTIYYAQSFSNIHFSDSTDRKFIIIRKINDTPKWEIWIEGIGSWAGVLESSNHLIVEDYPMNFLKCYFENNLNIYNDQSYGSNCYFTILNLEKYETKSFDIYPNPTSDFLNIETHMPEEPTLIIMTDITGRIVNQSAFTNRIDVSHLPEGMYLMKIHSKHGIIYSGKIVKQ